VNIALLRVVAQRLAGPRPDGPDRVVAHLSAMQGQDLRGAIRSVALRTDPAAGDLAAREAAVHAALAGGTIVRSWPMRGTLHLVPARDLHWMLSLTRPRMEAGAARRREQLGIDEPMYARARDLVEAALAGRGPLSRAELVQVLEPVGAGAVQGRTYHLLHLLAIREVIVQGPPHPARPGEQLFALSGDWITDPIDLAPDEAVARWADAYFRSHGPATVQDFSRWTGLPVTTARRGLAAVSGELGHAVVDGVEHWMDPATPDLLAHHRREAEETMMLPGFDELLLGYSDRTATLPAQWSDAVVPGRNGMFRPTVVHRGVVVGTWARTRAGDVEATPFTRFTKPQEAAIARLAADAGR
jgi:hypothetical protein